MKSFSYVDHLIVRYRRAPNTLAEGASTAADLRRLRRAPGRGSLSLCLQFEALVRVCVCLFDCLLLCLVGWLAVCGHMVFLLCLAS